MNYRYPIVIGLIIFLSALLLGGVSRISAQTEPDATISPDELNMRFGPGTEYAVIAKLVYGTELTLLGRSDVPGQYLWVYARTLTGTEGWLASEFLNVRDDLDVHTLPVLPPPDSLGTPATEEPTPVPEATTPPATDGGFPPGTGIPAQIINNVNFRGGPGTNYPIFYTLSVGTSALAKGRDTSGDWVFISANSQDGWVHGDFIELSSGDVAALPLTDTIIQSAAAPTATSNDSSSGGTVPQPVTGGAGLAGFGYGGHVDSFAYPDLMHKAGMTWAKRQIRYVVGLPGNVTAGAIDQAHANGFKILLGIVGYPEHMGTPGYFEDYARFVGEVAALGPDAIEVWNEQNIDREWPNGQIDPGRYTQLLAMAYNAIKSVNPNVAVISGAPAPTGAEGAFGTAAVWNDDRYVRGMAAAGAANYMDCIGAHYNEGIVSPNQTSGDPRGDYYTRYFWGMVNTYSSAFGGARPVCFTELGYVSPEGLGPLPASFAWGSDTSVGEQAAWLDSAVQLAQSSGRIKLVIIWNVDFTLYSGDPMAGYAIIRPGGSCPACDALGQ
jgi:uncharacterized protein YraI